MFGRSTRGRPVQIGSAQAMPVLVLGLSVWLVGGLGSPMPLPKWVMPERWCSRSRGVMLRSASVSGA